MLDKKTMVMVMHRRIVQRARILSCVVLGVAALYSVNVAAFDFTDVAKRAKVLATKSYKKPDDAMPQTLRNLTYEQYRDIHFRPEKSYWRDDNIPFEISFMHRGGIFNEPVRINEISSEGVRPINFDPRMFDYGNNRVDMGQLRGLGFSGFRIRFPINSSKVKDDVLSFQGASYFRAMGKDQGYGISARGLAIDTALYSGEEFPRFVEFWLGRPASGEKVMTILALLDSPNVTGAYRFVLKPGTDTVMDVKAELYFRNKVNKLGIAPLTSMFFFGENQLARHEDLRPEVHDSDGLSINAGNGEWIWRPLVNPKRLLVTNFAMENPVGFGLMQRDRQFSSYEDLENRYEARPSTWITPREKWGEGSVELVQIPTPDETNDNIVAYWMPKTLPVPGKPFNLEYSMAWQKNAEKRPPLAWVTQTRFGTGTTTGSATKNDGTMSVNIDFMGDNLKKLSANSPVESMVDIDDNGRIVSVNTRRNVVTGGWRVELVIRRNEDSKPVEMRAFLRNAGSTLSETWSYILPPN